MRHNLDYNNKDAATPLASSSIPFLGIEAASAKDGRMPHRSAKGTVISV
jgi:hypothetical protein